MATTKITRKDIAKMSLWEFMRVSREPYLKLGRYLAPYKWRFFLGILFGALYGIANGLLIFTVYKVTALVFPGPGAVVSIPYYGDIPVGDISLAGVLAITASIPLLMTFRGVCSYLNSYCMLWVSLRVLDDIRTQLFARLMGQSMEFFNLSKSGELIQTVFNQTRMAQAALTTISGDLVKQPISILGALAALLLLDARFTLGALILFPLCILPVVLVGKKVRKSGTQEEEEAGLLMVIMQEAFAGIRLVKSTAREDYEIKRFNAANNKMMQLIMRWRKAMEIVGPMVESVASLGIAAALIYAWHYNLGFPKFFALAGGLMLLYPPFKALSKIHILMQKCLAATTKVFELMEREPAIVDAPNASRIERCAGRIDFENVTFTYGSAIPAVRHVSIRIPAGTSCALVGESGAGKSSLLSLLLRLYDVTDGRVLIDGRDLRDITQASLREHVGIVSQDTFLFHDTIYNNIRYGRLDATREEIEAAARRAHAHDFILAQPEGYNSVIGDKGSLLSGGQQQRLSIARALLKNAPVLLLDEATSALDSESEKHIQAALDELSTGRTVIAIAHRLSTILKADQIVVMERGEVLAIGRHAELYAKSPIYRRLCDLQFNAAHEHSPALAEMANEG